MVLPDLVIVDSARLFGLSRVFGTRLNRSAEVLITTLFDAGFVDTVILDIDLKTRTIFAIVTRATKSNGRYR
jgi:hypothetical protein